MLRTHQRTSAKEKGQSLVELALIFPIVLLIVAGLVEIGAVMNAKLTVVNSAREAARYGVFETSDEDITASAQMAAAPRFGYRTENSDIYVIHAKTDVDGSISDTCPQNRDEAASYWCVNHTLGNGPAAPSFVTRADLEERLGGIGDMEFVAVAVDYDHESIVGLPILKNLAEGTAINSFSVMRLEEGQVESGGCVLWPMGMSTTAANWPNGHPKGTDLESVLDVTDPGNFGWLSWSGSPSASTLATDLTNPNNSLSNYTNPLDPHDHTVSVGDWVPGAQGWMQSVVDEIESLNDRYIRIAVFDTNSDTAGDPNGSCHGNNCYFRIIGYAIVQVDGEMNASDKSLPAKFIRFDTSCE